MKVVIVGAHLTSGTSMQRYTSLLERAYAAADVEAWVLRPPAVLSTRWRWPGRKWIGYVEKFLLFWPALRRAAAAADLVHVADHSDAIWALGLRRRRVLVTCHDLIAVRAALGELPEHRPGRSGRLYQRLVLAGLRRCTRVVSVSQSTAADVERLTGHERQCLYNPIDDNLAASGEAPALPWEDYLLVVSTRSWRKRRHASVRAWSQLRRTEMLQGCGLVVVGDPLGPEELALAGDDPAGTVVHLEGVTDAQLSALYAGARAMVHLSRYEGFGWPLVEAQLHRTPVLASDGEVFREVAGAHACFLDDAVLERGSAQDWEGISRELLGVDLERAAEQTGRFGWPVFVERLGSLVRDPVLSLPGHDRPITVPERGDRR